jgi:hypothetical protein
MGFDDIFENRNKQHGNYRGHHSHDDNRYNDGHGYSQHRQHPYPGYNDHDKWLTVLSKIRGNKKLQLILVIAVIVILVVTIGLVIALFPLIIKLINHISQIGLQGVFDSVTAFIDKLWKGSGK